MTDPISVTPTLTGKGGRAWKIDIQALIAKRGFNSDEDATVAMWMIEAPWAHPVWHSYGLILVHLRPLRVPDRPRFYLPGATHELWLHALNPEDARQGVFETGQMAFLHPLNYAVQLIRDSDEAAALDIETRAVRPILDGTLSPDTDFIAAWEVRFGDNMRKRW